MIDKLTKREQEIIDVLDILDDLETSAPDGITELEDAIVEAYDTELFRIRGLIWEETV